MTSTTSPPAGASRWWLPGVFVVEALIFLPSLIAAGIIRAPLFKNSESTGLFYAWGMFWRDEVAAGRLPFWNPFTFGGMPIAAEPQAYTFYPSHLLWLIAPSELAFKLSFLVHVWIGSWLMYRLIRELGANRAGAAIGAFVFGVHGQLIGFVYAGWIHQVQPMAWAPGVIWMFCRALRRSESWPSREVAGAAGMLGLQLTTGHPEWVRYTLYIIGILTIGGIPGRLAGMRRSFVNRAGICLVTVLLGLVIGGIQLAPTAQATLHSARGQQAMASGVVRSGAGLPVLSLPTMVVPRLFGPWDQTLTIDGLVHKLSGSSISYSESLIYVGVLPLGLGVVAWRRRRDTGAAIWGVIALAGVLFAMNDRTHLVSLIDRIVTIDSTFRSPGRFVFLTNFALAVLAGLGASQLSRTPEDAGPLRAGLLWLVGIIGVSTASLWLARNWILDQVLARVRIPAYIAGNSAVAADGGRTLGTWAIAHAVSEAMAAGLFLMMSAFLLQAARQRFRPWIYAGMFAIVALDLNQFARPMLSNTVAPGQVYAADADVLRPLTVASGIRVTGRSLNTFGAGDNVTMVLRVRSLLGYDSFSLAEWDRLWNFARVAPLDQLAALNITHVITRAGDGEASVTAVPNARGRVWFTDRVDVPLAVGAALPASTAAVDVTRDVPGSLDATVDAPASGWLVFGDVFYPGWTARVNGIDTTVSKAFEVFQAVPVPAGPSRVEFSFRPAIVRWGAACSALGVLAAIALAWRRRESRPPAGRP